ncbi:MAG: RNA chaperone Hfq [Clostridia bacterium]|nr:RNA chaperone Hfq [Clostridia bacterium]
MQKQMNIQDYFLNVARKDRIGLTVYLVNGFQFRGTVKSFDSYSVVLEAEGKQRLVYKHAISTIVPDKNIELNTAE